MRKIQDRSITRSNKKKFNQEERLNSKTEWNTADLTARDAVDLIIAEGRKSK